MGADARTTTTAPGICRTATAGIGTALGIKLAARERPVALLIGDGSFLYNPIIQALDASKRHALPIVIVILNNKGYGIIKQFQDSYFGSRYEATGRGYSTPDFGKVAAAYGIDYVKVERLNQLNSTLLSSKGAIIIDVMLDEHTLIQPKLEMGRPINDQFPYVSNEQFAAANAFVEFTR